MRVLLALILGMNAATAAAQTSGPVVFTPNEVLAAENDPKRFTIDPKSVRFVKLGAAVSIDQVLPGIPTPPGPAPQDPLVFLDRIINLANKIWAIIEKNKPVVDITTTYANAHPEGITHWSQLGEWKPPVGTIYAFHAKNGYGTKVIDVRYQVIRTIGGKYKGKGRYLNGVSVQPLRVDVAWGYKFKMGAKVPSVANVGTTEDPIASMILNLSWAIDTVIKHSEGTSVYYLQGDGVYREIGGPFENRERKTAKALAERSAAWFKN